jgi:hypothetical protein
MAKLRLFIKAELDGVTDLTPVDTEENPYFYTFNISNAVDESSRKSATDKQPDKKKTMTSEPNVTRTYSNSKHTILVLNGEGGSFNSSYHHLDRSYNGGGHRLSITVRKDSARLILELFHET